MPFFDFDDVTPPAMPAGLTAVDGGVTVATGLAYTPPNALVSTAVSPAIKKARITTTSADYRILGVVYFTNPVGDNAFNILYARANADFSVAYAVNVYALAGVSNIGLDANGGSGHIATVVVSGTLHSKYLFAIYVIIGDRHLVAVENPVGSGNWIKSDGTTSVGFAYCIDENDSSIADGGYAGWANYADHTGGSALFDNVALDYIGYATGFTADPRQSAVNQLQKGIVNLVPTPTSHGTFTLIGFAQDTTITATSTDSTSNFINQSDGTQTVGSMSTGQIIVAINTPFSVMETWATGSTSSFAWSNNRTISSSTATTFTVNTAESSYQTATPDGGWDPTDPGSGFSTTPEASTVSHGTGFSGYAILAGTDRVWGEYVTSGTRTIVAPTAHGDPSKLEKVELYCENDTPVVARNGRLAPSGCNWFGPGVVFSADGAVSTYVKATPFNGKEYIVEGLVYFDLAGDMPRVGGTVSNFTQLLTALSTDPSDTLAVYHVPANTNIVMTATAFQTTYSFGVAWGSNHPLMFEGADQDTSVLSSDLANGWFSRFQFVCGPASIIFKNMTIDFTLIGMLSTNSQSLIFDNCRIISVLPEDSRHKGGSAVVATIFENAVHGTFCINGTKGRVYTTQGLVGPRGVDGVVNRFPDFVVGGDFYQNLDTGVILNTYAKRFTHQGYENTMPSSVITTLTATATVFEPGTNSNLTRITATGWPTADEGGDYLAYIESIYVTSGPMIGTIIPIVIGRTDPVAGYLYAGGDVTALGAATFQVSAIYMQRENEQALVITGATNNHNGTATLTWADAGDDPTSINSSERMRFYTTTTTATLRGLMFEKFSINNATQTIIVYGENAGSAVAGDTIWLSQIYHADADQLGLQSGQTSDGGPYIQMNYVNEGFQSGLFQSGDTYSITNYGAINLVTVGFAWQIQWSNSNCYFENVTLITTLRQSALTSVENFGVNNSILQDASAFNPAIWNNAMVLTNSHGVDGTLPSLGIGNTSGTVVYDAFYNATASSLQRRAWNTGVAFDLYHNAATTNGSTYARIGAVLGDPTGAVVVAGTVSTNGTYITLVFVADTVVINDNDLFEVYVNGILTPHGTVVDVPGGDVEGLTKQINMLSVIYSTDVVTVTLLAGAVDIDGDPNVETDNIPITNNSTIPPVPFVPGILSVVGRTTTTIDVTFTAATGGVGSVANVVQYRVNNAGAYTNSSVTASPGTVTGLAISTLYGLRTSYTDDNETVFSNVVTETTGTPLPPAGTISHATSGLLLGMV